MYRIVLSLLLFTISVYLYSCKKENKNYNSRWTLVNAVPNSRDYSFSFAGEMIDSTLAYGLPLYEKTAPATTGIMEWKHNTIPFNDSSFMTDIPNGQDYTFIFYDSIGRQKTWLQKDDWKKSSDKKGYLRFFPLVIGSKLLNIRNDTNKTIIQSRAFGSFLATGSDFLEVDTFTTKLRLYENATLLDSLPNTTILAGHSYSIYAIGVLGQSGDKRPKMIIHQHE